MDKFKRVLSAIFKTSVKWAIILIVAFFVLLIISVTNGWNERYQTECVLAMLFLSIFVTVYPLIRKEKISYFEIICVALCFLFLLIAIVVFAAVSEGKYRDPVIQISAAFVGGMLTLYGVGLSIKYNRLAKESDDILKAKPHIFSVSEEMLESLEESSNVERELYVRPDLSTAEQAKKGEDCYYFDSIYLANSDLSMCTIKGIIVDDKTIVFHFDTVLLRGSTNCFVFDYNFKLKKTPQSIKLVLGDMLDNTYTCSVSFFVDEKKNRKKNPIYIMGVLKTVLMDNRKYPVFEKK